MKIERQKFNTYIDESGIASLTDLTCDKFILTGVIIDDKEDVQLSAYFNFIKRKYKIPEDNSFHTYDLFENKKYEFYLKNNDALKLAESLAEFIKISPIRSLCLFLNKNDLRNFLGIKDNSYFKGEGSSNRKRDKDIGYEMLATKIFLWFGKCLNQNNGASGKIIVESRQNLDYAVLKSYLLCKQSNRFKTKRLNKASSSFGKNVSAVNFESKIGLCGGLEIADLISYISSLSIKKQISSNEKRGIPILWDAIKEILEKNKIQTVELSEFKNLISFDRVNKITNYIKQNKL